MSEREQTWEIEGPITWRGDASYESTRASMLWNDVKPDRFPDVIVRAASERDVPGAVRLARSRGLRIAVRSGGHSWCGSPLRDGGMLIDLSRLRGCTVEPASMTASVQPGVTGRGLAAALARHGLAFPVGHCGSVSPGGYLLSGGLGWNSGAWGPGCQSVQEIEAVTAGGEVVRCSEQENPDLFWAARGAGPGFFAVVTRFRLGLRPLPAGIVTAGYVFPLADVAEVTHWAAGIAAELPPFVELSAVLGTASSVTAEAPPGTKVIIVTAVAFANSWEEAGGSLQAFHACPLAGRALFRGPNRPATFDTLFDASQALWPERHRYAADDMWSASDIGVLLPELAGDIADAPSGKSLVLAVLSPLAPEGVPLPDMAFSVLGTAYFACYAIWEDPAHDDADIRWLRETMRKVEPLGTGHYIAETDLPADPSRARRSFAPGTWERLRALRARYDPEGLFHSYLGP
ncbi:FAD-binding oxidoreductase [Streptosporangium sp. NPDC000396]|uniref:FAD-binding oxidoreductase n=1 Tax=Streptosporangium sp. NPDC000396 TaxID=3366185 RepID=UPI00367AC2D4